MRAPPSSHLTFADRDVLQRAELIDPDAAEAAWDLFVSRLGGSEAAAKGSLLIALVRMQLDQAGAA